MRIDVVKYLIMGPMSIRSSFFQKLQEHGIVEFISKTRPSLETPHEIQNYIQALHVLRQMVPVAQAPTDDYRTAGVLARDVVEINQELEQFFEKRRLTEMEIARIGVFGDFSLPTLREIERESGRVVQFFFAKKSELLAAPKRPEVIFVGHNYGLDYFVTINKERASYEGFIEILIEKTLGELEAQLAHINRRIDEFETELATLAHKKKLLQQGLSNALNHYHLEDSKERAQALLEGDLFAVEGWIPKNKIQLLHQLADEQHVFVEAIEIEEKDRIPTYLENRGFSRIGEDLINIYDTPSNTDKDPSLWVFIAFGLFFSMIVADAGYGLLLLGLSIYLYFKYGKKPGLGRRVILLAMSLSIGCIIWGTLLTSFFGIELAPDNKLRTISPINWMVKQKAEYLIVHKPKAYSELIHENPEIANATTPEAFLMGVKKEQEGNVSYPIYSNFTNNVMLELVIFIGTLHILLSFIRYLDRNWAGIGWMIFLIGAYLYFPLILGALSLIHYIFHVPYELGGLIGKYLVFIGLGLAVILALIQRRLAGLPEIMLVINIFADVMSYLRIYALSLAGMIMAATFNKIGTSMPLYIGFFVILAGHLVNITLALMGGVIHGLRLNFIEWYHYSFEGGGKHFNPLSLIKIE